MIDTAVVDFISATDALNKVSILFWIGTYAGIVVTLMTTILALIVTWTLVLALIKFETAFILTWLISITFELTTHHLLVT